MKCNLKCTTFTHHLPCSLHAITHCKQQMSGTVMEWHSSWPSWSPLKFQKCKTTRKQIKMNTTVLMHSNLAEQGSSFGRWTQGPNEHFVWQLSFLVLHIQNTQKMQISTERLLWLPKYIENLICSLKCAINTSSFCLKIIIIIKRKQELLTMRYVGLKIHFHILTINLSISRNQKTTIRQCTKFTTIYQPFLF